MDFFGQIIFAIYKYTEKQKESMRKFYKKNELRPRYKTMRYKSP